MRTVFVSGPYTFPDPAVNVRNAILAADHLMTLGFAPYVPHLTHFQHMLAPRPYEDWIALDLEWVSRSDCLLRLPGESPGADREVAYAKERGIPVFESIDVLYVTISKGGEGD